MTIDATNVVPFERPRPAPPALTRPELRLDDHESVVTLTAIDEAGDVHVFKLGLLSGDPDLLRENWGRWRGGAAEAS